MHHWKEYLYRWIALISLFTSLSCDDEPIGDVCDGIGCSLQGTCFVKNESTYCSCEQGYHPVGLECIINNSSDPCLGVNCNAHGTCFRDGLNPVCDCASGYSPDVSGLLCFAGSDVDDTDEDADEDGNSAVDGETYSDTDVEEDVESSCEFASNLSLIGPQRTLFNLTGLATLETLASSREAFAVVWINREENRAYFQLVDALGNIMSPPEMLENEEAGTVNVMWTGTDWAVVYSRGTCDGVCIRDIVFRRFDEHGAELGDEVVVDGDADVSGPRMVWTGSGFVILYSRRVGAMEVFARALAADGGPLGSTSTRLTSCESTNCFATDATWTGSQVAFVYWRSNGASGPVRIMLLDTDTTVAAGPFEVSLESALDGSVVPTVAFGSRRIAVTHRNVLPSQAEVRFYDTSGTDLGTVILGDVSTRDLKIVPVYDGFAVPTLSGETWSLTRLDASEALVGIPYTLPGEGTRSGTSPLRMAWTGEHWGIVFDRGSPDGDTEVVFDRISCRTDRED